MPNSWYYAAGNRQMGPVSENELDVLVDSGKVSANTLVWHQGLTNWLPYATARPERPNFVATAPPPPQPVMDPSSVEPSASASVPNAQPSRFCTQCGRPTPERELAQFGDRLVCAQCKPAFAHEIRERGIPRAGYRYAGFWIRFLARVLDGIIMYIVILPITFAVMGTRAFDTEPREFEVIQFGLLLFQVIFAAAYETWFVANFSATPGKMAIGKKVIVADGTRPTYLRALARHFANYISSFTLLIGYIIAAFDDEKRALHDRICDTRVVAK